MLCNVHINTTYRKEEVRLKYYNVAIGDEYGIDEKFTLTAQTIQGARMLAQKRCKEGQRVWYVFEKDGPEGRP